MTRKSKELGMKNTTFKNASGLPNRAQLTTARDIAILSRYIPGGKDERGKFRVIISYLLNKFTKF